MALFDEICIALRDGRIKGGKRALLYLKLTGLVGVLLLVCQFSGCDLLLNVMPLLCSFYSSSPFLPLQPLERSCLHKEFHSLGGKPSLAS